jgi:uncharacterized membrane protein YdbT with pleckstrin-like domain
MSETEHVVWKGGPSHVKDLPLHMLCLLTAFFVVPIFMSIWRFLTTKFHEFEITSERIRLTTGVLSRHMEEIELYRVKDTAIAQPFFLRLFGLANVVLRTSDVSSPTLTIEAIPDAGPLRETIRGCVEKVRQSKRVREVDFN